MTYSILSRIFSRIEKLQIKEAEMSITIAPEKGNINRKLFSKVRPFVKMPSIPIKKNTAPTIKTLIGGLVCEK